MFFIIPVGVDYRTDRMPVVTFTLIGLNTLIYFVSLFFEIQGGEETEMWILEHLWLIPAKSLWHTYITTWFVHAGFFHLLGNMIYLFLFGSPVEDIIGRWKFLLFYALGGFFADFLHIAMAAGHFESEIALGGASGAVSACLGGFVLLFHKVKIQFQYFVFFFFRFWSGEFWLSAWLVISFWFGEDLLFAVLGYMNEEEGGGGTAFAAHVGGFLGGLGLMAAYKMIRKRWPERDAADDEEPVPLPVTPEEAPTILLHVNGNQMGPFTRRQISQMMALGSVTDEAYYWIDGMAEWRSISELTDGD